MPTAKKPARKPRAAASPKQREMESAQTPEEMLNQLPAARSEHDREMADLGNRIVELIGETNYHPTVVLDTMQVLLSEGIGVFLGDEHKTLWNAYVTRFHEDSKMLSILETFTSVKPKTDPSTPPPTPEA